MRVAASGDKEQGGSKAVRHLATEVPYRGTKVGSEMTKGHISEMLKEFGATALRWTDSPDSMRGVDCPMLEFILEVELKGVQKQMGIRIKPPLLVVRKKKGYGRIVETPDMNASMRLLYWYLKARLEAARFGMEDITETFMSKIIMSLPEGGTSTMGEIMKERPELISSMLPTFEIKQKQLTQKDIEP